MSNDNKELEKLKIENGQLRNENAAFERLLRTTDSHYEGLQLAVAELALSLETAKEDSAKLVELLDQRKAAKKEKAEEGVQQGGTG